MFIYGLYSTKDNVIRYVGKTKNTLDKRLRQHIYDAIKKRVDTYKDRWIRKCYKDGYEVKITQIEKVNSDNINEREKFWIKQLPNLTNTAPGGEGGGLLVYDKSYEYCKNWLRQNMSDITSRSMYYEFSKSSKIPSFMPKEPRNHFSSTDEWISWGDFLSTDRIQDNKKALKYLSYREAKIFLKKLNLLTKPQYIKYLTDNKIDFLPKKPERFYIKQGWEGYGRFLGYKKKYEITEKLIIRYLNIFFKDVNTAYKYIKYSYKFNKAIPKNIVTLNKMFPNFDWNAVNKHIIDEYKVAEKLARSLKVTNNIEYRQIVKDKYKGILPLQPNLKYKDKGWRNWMTYLGDTNIKHRCDITLSVFRRYMKIYHPLIDSAKKYTDFYQDNKATLPYRLPSRPDIVFKMSYSEIFLVKPKRTVPICDLKRFISIMSEKHTDVTHIWQYKKLIKDRKLEDELPKCPMNKYRMKWNELLLKIRENNGTECKRASK